MITLPVGALIRGSLCLCQLPDYGAWVERQGAALTPEEALGLGATSLRYAAPARVPADSTIDFHNFLDLFRRGALVLQRAPSNDDLAAEELRKAS
jgi:hypothetical protein